MHMLHSVIKIETQVTKILIVYYGNKIFFDIPIFLTTIISARLTRYAKYMLNYEYTILYSQSISLCSQCPIFTRRAKEIIYNVAPVIAFLVLWE